MKTRIIWTKIWEDEFFANLTRSAKILFIYLISNQRINICGCYELPDRIIMFDTGLNSTELESSKKELFPKAKFYQGWVYLPSAKKLSGYKGEKNESASKKEESLIPIDIKEFLYRVSGKKDRVSSFRDTSINHKSEIINNKSRIINHKSLEILKKFNSILGKNFTSTRTWEDNYKKWLKEFKQEDILKAIGNIPKHPWLKDKDVSPTMFFRTDKDWIEQCLNLRKETGTRQRSTLDKYKTASDLVEEQKKRVGSKS